MASRKLQVEIIGDASSLQRAFGNVQKSSSRLGGGLRTLGKVASAGVGAAFVGMAATLKVGFDEMAEGQKVSAQTAAGLKSTGNVANVTAKEIENLAGAISRKTGIDDEAVQASENMLLTFTAVRNEVGKGNDIFNQATQAVSDMATRMNNGAIPSMEQLSKNSILVGKALNDPVKGMTALRRVGVAFTKSQEDQIKAMVKAGDTMGAQKLILAELTKEFGGSAKAAGDTFPGQLAKLRNSFEEMAGSLAESLLPYLQRFLDWANRNMPTIQRIMQGAIDLIIGAIETLADVFGKLEGPLATFKGWLEDNPEKAKILAGALIGLAGALTAATIAQAALNLAVLANPYVAAIAAIGLMVGALVTLYVTNQRVQQVVDENFRKIRAIVQDVVPVILAIWQRFGASFIAIGEAMFKTVTLGVRNMLDVLRGIVNVFAGVFTGDWKRVWQGVKQIFDGMIGNLLGVVRSWASALLTVARQAGVAIVQGVIAGLARLVPAVMEKLLALRPAVMGMAAQAANWAADIGVAIISGIIRGLAGLASRVASVLIDEVKGGIASALIPFKNSPQEVIGFALADGILRGYEEKAGALGPKMEESVKGAIEDARQAIGDAGSKFAAAFGDLASVALEAFDAKMSQIETRSERALRLLDEAARKSQILEDLKEAQAGLAEARATLSGIQPQEGESPEEFVARLRAAEAAVAAAEKDLADARLARRRFDLEQQAAAERKALDDRIALRRKHFEEDLAALQNYANRHALTAEQLNQRLIAIFNKYHVPFKKAAISLGSALAEGLQDAAVEVGRQARAVRDEIMRHLSNIQIRINVDVVTPDKPDRDQHRQHGGPVRRNQAYIVGEAGPEIFIPGTSGQIIPNNVATSGAMLGGGNVTFNFPNYVGSRDELIETVRRGLIDIGRYSPGVLGGRA